MILRRLKEGSNVLVAEPSDNELLAIIKKVCPEHYDRALENYLKKLGEKNVKEM